MEAAIFKVLKVVSALRAGFTFLCEKIQSGEYNCSLCCRKDVSGARNTSNSCRRGSSPSGTESTAHLEIPAIALLRILVLEQQQMWPNTCGSHRQHMLPHYSGGKLTTGLLQKLLLLLFPSSFPSSQLHASTSCYEGHLPAA